MKTLLIATSVLGAICLTAIPMAANAASMKELQGAWTMNGTDCADTFKKVGKRIAFKDRTSLTSTGLLVAGRKVTGPMAVCTAKSIHRKKDRLSASLSCEDSMMVNEVTQIFKIVSATEFQRFDPFGDNMYVTYHKCNM
ncbi:MAG: hypothetical protein ACRECY_15620 [Phyllobacterium sp.]